MARTRNHQEPTNVVCNNNLVPQIGSEVTSHSESSVDNRAAEEGRREGTDLPRYLSQEQLREVTPSPSVMANMRRSLGE